MTQAAILSASASSGVSTGYKNKIINGAMVIAQRGTGTTSTGFVNQVDQFQVATNAMSFTFGQSSSAPTGFIKSSVVTNTSAVTPSGAQYYSVRTFVEGYNIADLGWGTAAAKPVTLSFWVNSSVTGLFGGSFLNGASVNYCYPFSYTINQANTWEYKTVIVVGPTSGTWAVNTDGGIMLEWSLGCGSTYSGTAGAWSATRLQGVTGQTQWSATNNATFYITGVQLEVGTTATNFEYRDYGNELRMCQRYFYVIVNQAPVGSSIEYCSASFYSATELNATVMFPVTMRAPPSIVQTSGTNYHYVDKAGTSLQFNSWTGMTRAGPNSALLYLPSLSGYVAGYGTNVYSYNNSTFVAASAEL
jgi:hypothetical protein